MLLRTKLHGKTYEFPDIRLLMGKANEEKSGDHLAGVGAETAAERVAAKLVLAEVPLWVLRENPGFFSRIQSGVTYANRRGGATTGAWPGTQAFCGWKASGTTGRGVGGPFYLLSFLREQAQMRVR